jgi:hypothetical protein
MLHFVEKKILLLVIIVGSFRLWFCTKDLKMSSTTCHLFGENFISAGRISGEISPVRPYYSIILRRIIYKKYISC